MADEFTPTTEQVCETYAALCGTEAAAAEFWRWLAAHDRDTLARAWDEGAEAGRLNAYEHRPGREMHNPYRVEGV